MSDLQAAVLIYGAGVDTGLFIAVLCLSAVKRSRRPAPSQPPRAEGTDG
jgi:hypothetical protein